MYYSRFVGMLDDLAHHREETQRLKRRESGHRAKRFADYERSHHEGRILQREIYRRADSFVTKTTSRFDLAIEPCQA